jgi:hypothetical protein
MYAKIWVNFQATRECRWSRIGCGVNFFPTCGIERDLTHAKRMPNHEIVKIQKILTITVGVMSDSGLKTVK